jgi:hypothetical protein
VVNALFADGVSSRADVTATSGRGVGLGAARHACERLGGHVTVESDAGVGTTFRFHLPTPDRRTSLVPRSSKRDPLQPSGGEQVLIRPEGIPHSVAPILAMTQAARPRTPSQN